MDAGGKQPGVLHLGSVAWADRENCPLSVLQQADLLNQRDSMRTMEGNKLLWVEVYRDSNLGG